MVFSSCKICPGLVLSVKDDPYAKSLLHHSNLMKQFSISFNFLLRQYWALQKCAAAFDSNSNLKLF